MAESVRNKYNSILIILLCSLILLVIMQPWNLYFLNDDFEHIPMAGKYLVTKNFLRPIANLFLFLDKFLYGKWAPGYFFTTWLLHVACAISIYFTSHKIIEKYVPDLPLHAALLTALFFLFYPFHAEPLFWIIARGAVIAALFAVLSLYCYISKDEHQYCFLLAWLLFIIALFTYESIWGVLFLYCLISFFNVRKRFVAARKEYALASVFIFTFLLYLIIRFFSLNTFTGEYAEIDDHISKVSLLLSNLIKLIARNFTPPFANIYFSLIFFSVSALIYCFAIISIFKKSKSAGWLTILLCFGMITGVFTATPLGIDTHGNESERFIYYSSFFFCFFLAIAVTVLFRKQVQYIISGFIIISGITGLIVYNANYRYTAAAAKISLEFVDKYQNYKKAYFIDVPGEYKGALLFRVCLPNAINWIDEKCTYDSVIIISKTENASGISPFKTGEKTWAELSREKNFESKLNTYSLKDSLNQNIIVQKSDAIFWFKPEGLYKVNPP